MPTPFPTAISPEAVDPTPHFAVAQFDNPVTLSHEVQEMAGFRWEIVIRLQKMSPVDAALFGAFVQSQKGGAETFTFDLTPWAPGWDPAPGVRTFRFAKNDIGWSADYARQFGFTFTAFEDV